MIRLRHLTVCLVAAIPVLTADSGPGWDPITGFGAAARAFQSDVC